VPSKATKTSGYPTPGAESRAPDLPNVREECQPLNTMFDGKTVSVAGLGGQQQMSSLSRQEPG
jgi:hypothetical protein